MYECNDKMVSHPDHYQAETGMEVIDVIESFTFDLKGIEAVDTGNALKYLCRWKKKNGLQDLKKARWYLEHLIDHVEKLEMENQYVQNDIQISKDLAAELKRKEVMEGFDPVGDAIKKEMSELKAIDRYQCNHCKSIVEIVDDTDPMLICGFHMNSCHPECRDTTFALDFTQLDSKFINKEND